MHLDLLVDYNDIQFNELLGRGNFGSVYKGIWMQKTVALKKISIPADMNTQSYLTSNKEIAALRFVMMWITFKN